MESLGVLEIRVMGWSVVGKKKKKKGAVLSESVIKLPLAKKLNCWLRWWPAVTA